jgi:hypothetical protein
MGYPGYIYAEKVYHRDIRDYWMNKSGARVRSVPKVASHLSLLSVSFGGNRSSPGIPVRIDFY